MQRLCGAVSSGAPGGVEDAGRDVGLDGGDGTGGPECGSDGAGGLREDRAVSVEGWQRRKGERFRKRGLERDAIKMFYVSVGMVAGELGVGRYIPVEAGVIGHGLLTGIYVAFRAVAGGGNA